MPKYGEKKRKLSALKRGKGVRPPKKWFDKLKRTTSKQYPGYGKKRVGKIVGGIWSKMSEASKARVVKKYQK